MNEDFIEFACAEGISLEDPDDYEPWYRCWMYGFNSALQLHSAEKITERIGECNKLTDMTNYIEDYKGLGIYRDAKNDYFIAVDSVGQQIAKNTTKRLIKIDIDIFFGLTDV